MKGKKFHLKSLLSLFLIFTFLFTAIPQVAFGAAYNPKEDYKELDLRFWNDEKPDIGFYINAAAKYTLERIPEAGFSNEWNVVGLTRGLYTGFDYINEIPEDYFENYIKSVEDYTISKNGEMDRNKLSEWSRPVLALTALGHDVTNVAGYDFIEAHAKSPTQAIQYNQNTGKMTYRQGINAPIWGLMALKAGNYSLLDDMEDPTRNTEGKMLDHILENEIVQADGTVGGWALWGNTPDADIGGMALQALAPYYLDRDKYEATGAQATYEEFAKAVERGILAMKNIQQDNGGFSALGFSGATINSQSIVQIIVALTALGIDPLAEKIELKHINENISFITDGGSIDGIETNNMIDALLVFWDPESGSSPEVGGFKNVLSYGADGMATEQSLYGLVAYDRFLKGENSLYDMTDMMNEEYKQLLQAPKNDVLFKAQNVLVEGFEKSPYAVIEVPNGLVQDGKTFIGWNSKEDGSGTEYQPGERLVIPNHDITLYAQYEYDEFNIRFETGGGTFIGSNFPTTYTVEDEIVLPSAEEVLFENHEFKGWYENEDLTGEPVTKIEKGSLGSKTFYAKWELSSIEDDETEEPIKVNVDELTNGSKVIVEVNPGKSLIFENKESNSAAKLVLPKTLPEGTIITVQKPDEDELPLKETEFNLAGDVFDITLEFPNNESYEEGEFVLTLTVDPNIDVTTANVYHYNAEVDMWELVNADEKNSEDNTITVTVSHFSIYAVLAEADHTQDEDEDEDEGEDEGEERNNSPQNNSNNTNNESNDDGQGSNQTNNETNEGNNESGNTTNNSTNETNEAENNKLPNTATSIYNMMLLGLALLIAGFITFMITRKVVQ